MKTEAVIVDDGVIDSVVFEEMKQELVRQVNIEITSLQNSINNVEFSKVQLEKQLVEKKRMLNIHLNEAKRLENVTFDSLITNKGQ